MYKKFVTPVYILNIIFQSIFNLVTPAGLMFLIAWLLDRHTEVGGWIYALLTVVGVLIGFRSMISFILKASHALETIEKQNSQEEKSRSSQRSDSQGDSRGADNKGNLGG